MSNEGDIVMTSKRTEQVILYNAWMAPLTKRQCDEVRFSENYVKNFNHGTPSHNHFVLIAALAKMLGEVCEMTYGHTSFSTDDAHMVDLGNAIYDLVTEWSWVDGNE